MALLIFYIVLAIAVSFMCSIMEAVLLSLTPSHLAKMRDDGHPMAGTLHEYKRKIDEPLAAILTANTIAHTIGAAGAGAQAAKVFGDKWLGVFSGVLTLLILFASEIIPKTIGAVYWKRLAGPIARLLRMIILPMKPFIWMSKIASRMIGGDPHAARVSRAEIAAIAELGAEQGVFGEDESRILRALFRFRSLRAKDIMTPRTVISAIPESQASSAVLQNADTLPFSRIPVYETSIDDISGYVLKDEMLERLARGLGDHPLSEIRRDVLFIPQVTPVSELLETFLASREHLAVVVDEFGGTAGLITLEDVVETLLDMEIVDEADHVTDLQAAARKDWMRRARSMGIIDEHGAPTSPTAAANTPAATTVEPPPPTAD